MNITEKIEDRFWSKVNIPHGGFGCWEWTASKSTSGYGHMWVSGRLHYASRIVWTIVHGAVPAGLFVLHHCDNPGCVNPSHLFIGTAADNSADMVAKGRLVVPPLDKHGRAKLTNEEVQEVRMLLSKGFRQETVGGFFGLSRSAVGHIAGKRTWKGLSDGT